MRNKVTMANNSILGRFLVASEFTPAGEILLIESPLIVGAPLNDSTACFRCNCRLCGAGTTVCNACNLAVFCSEKCATFGHCKLECKAAQHRLGTLKNNVALSYPQTILPLRILLMRDYKSDVYAKFMELEGHVKERKDTNIWNYCEEKIVHVLQQLAIFPDEEDAIQRICGILDVNSFELRAPQADLHRGSCVNRGIYLQIALIAHDCISNVHISQDDQFKLIVRANRDLQPNEAIFFNYSNPLQGTQDRRKHLLAGKYFECKCVRCSDATELSTDISSIICPHCRSMILRSIDPVCDAYGNGWKCGECSHSFSGQMILTAITQCTSVMNDTSESIEGLEIALEKLSRTLAKNHYLILELKQKLIGLYTQQKPTKNLLQRKIELCTDLLPVFQRIEPGISRLTGILLYELYAAEFSLAQENPDEEQRHSLLLKAKNNLAEALAMLKYEPSLSPEGRLFAKASNDLQMLQNQVDLKM